MRKEKFYTTCNEEAENKEFYDAIMNSLGNVIYRLMKNEYDEDSKEQDNNLKVAEDSEEYKLEE